MRRTRIVEAGITRVVAAMEDPNPLVQRPRLRVPARARRDGRGRARRDAAVALNQPFFTLMREGRPFVMLKAATSLDGCIAAAPGGARR